MTPIPLSLSKGARFYPFALAMVLSSCTTWRSPEEGVSERLARAGREGISMAVTGGGTARLEQVSFSELVLRVADSGRRATVLCRAEGQGALDGVPLSYVGGETIELAIGRSGWQPVGPWLPALAGVLKALAPVAAPARSGWAIRVERGHAIASESSATDGGERVRRFELDRGPEGWRIASGLL